MVFSERNSVSFIVRPSGTLKFIAWANAVFINVEADGTYTYQCASKAKAVSEIYTC
jgi:hypothetical protein